MNHDNKKTPPPLSDTFKIGYPKVTIVNAKNGIPVHIIRSGTQKVIKLDLIFNAGTRQTSPLIPKATADLIVEATKSFDSETLSTLVDNNGAYLYSEIDRDRVSLSLVVLEKFCDILLEAFQEVVLHPQFSSVDFERYRVKRKQQHIQSLEKTATMAAREFAGQLFGKSHPYGRIIDENDYNTLQLEELKLFHQDFYTSRGTYAIVTGQFSDKTMEKILDLVESIPSGFKHETKDFTPKPESLLVQKIKKNNAKQATIKIGGFAINRKHPDYPALKIVNTFLGGYFGSRLMQVIREQKGLTYGIGSSLISMEHCGYWTIQGDVLVDKVDEVISDVENEILRLRTELVSDEELSMVKNYLQGDILQRFDGPFTTADTYRVLADYDMGLTYFDSLQKTILSITKHDIMQFSNQYLDFKNAYITVVGD